MAIVLDSGSGLRVRSKPSTNEDSVKYEPLLASGSYMTVLAGPVAGSGLWWYRVRLENGLSLVGGHTAGWVAAGARDGTPWIGPYEFDERTVYQGWPTVEGQDARLTGEVVSEYAAGIGRIYLDVKVTHADPGSAMELRAQADYRIGWDCGASGSYDWIDAGVTEGTAQADATLRIASDGTASAHLVLAPDEPVAPCPSDYSALNARWAEWTGIRASDLGETLVLGPTTYGWASD